MFVGEFTHTLDEKGRLTLPARWREELGQEVFVTRGLDDCLFIFPKAKFEIIAQEYDALGLGKKDARELSRFFFSKTSSDTPDKQGRIIIPQNLRNFAGIDGEAVMIGANSRIELWSVARYRAMDNEVEVKSNEISERISDLLGSTIARVKN